MTAATRTLRLCASCGALDADPAHVLGVPPGYPDTVPDSAFLDALPDGIPARALVELMDPSTVVRHMDCCAAAGCQVCVDVLAATGGATGSDLIAALESGSADYLTTTIEGI